MKIATTAPRTLNARFRGIGTMPALRRLLSHASKAETVTKNPNTTRAHTPTDMGDQYLKLRPVSPGVTSTIMCQNFHQLTPRSAVSRTGQITVVGKLTRNAMLAAGSSRGSPEHLLTGTTT